MKDSVALAAGNSAARSSAPISALLQAGKAASGFRRHFAEAAAPLDTSKPDVHAFRAPTQ